MKKLINYILISLFLATTLANTVFASKIEKNDLIVKSSIVATTDYQAPQIPKPSTLPGPTSTNTRSELVDKVLPRAAVFLIGIVGGLALLFTVIGGVRFAMAYGNDEAIEKAKKQVIYGIIGLIVALLSYTIVTIVSNLTFVGDSTKQEVSFIPTTYAESIDQLVPRPNFTEITNGNKTTCTNNADCGIDSYCDTKQNICIKNYEELKAVQNLPDITPQQIIASIIKTILGWSMLIALAAIIVSAIYYLNARGKEEDISKAKNIIIYLIIGMAIMAAAYGIITGIAQFKFFQ